jgi:hypothetical protein
VCEALRRKVNTKSSQDKARIVDVRLVEVALLDAPSRHFNFFPVTLAHVITKIPLWLRNLSLDVRLRLYIN